MIGISQSRVALLDRLVGKSNQFKSNQENFISRHEYCTSLCYTQRIIICIRKEDKE